MWKTTPMLILASKSSARAALLAGAGIRFETCPATIDERAVEAAALGKGIGPPNVARALAEAKALDVARAKPGALVVGADQVLALGAELQHKPKDMAEAALQLQRLRGRVHHLHAGVALARDANLIWSDVETAELVMRNFSADERDRVLALEGDAILGSVGAYRLEGPSIRLFEQIRGDYFTVLGLPLLPLLAALRSYAPQLLR